MEAKSFFTSKSRELFLLGFIALICVVISCMSDGFFKPSNIQNLFRTNMIYGIMSLGMMIVIATGNVDVSVGPTMVCAGAVSAKLIVLMRPEAGLLNPILTFAVAIAVGALIGCINGFFVAYCKVPSLIATLGTYSVLRGSICLVTGGRWITGFPGWFITFANIKVMGIYIGTLIWAFLIVLTWFIMNRMNLGRRLLAVGGNPSAASRAGIKCERYTMFAFIYQACLTSIAGVLFFSQVGVLDPLIGQGYEMTVIAAVIIGGTLLSGGVASTSGTVLGVLVLGIINSLLVFAHIPVFWQKFATGVLLLIAILASYIKKGSRSKTNTLLSLSAKNDE